ncbi:hypothetical protein QYM36_013136 [Artemia franciscana]|uniref:RRM domain-containing protein n=1 Tax=Artemia franciscana TaxID=6661 RepID=A0AA88HFI8_ARTSF|nr:hypothetical protein QYM36_013136 [Artemia franciscana]
MNNHDTVTFQLKKPKTLVVEFRCRQCIFDGIIFTGEKEEKEKKKNQPITEEFIQHSELFNIGNCDIETIKITPTRGYPSALIAFKTEQIAKNTFERLRNELRGGVSLISEEGEHGTNDAEKLINTSKILYFANLHHKITSKEQVQRILHIAGAPKPEAILFFCRYLQYLNYGQLTFKTEQDMQLARKLLEDNADINGDWDQTHCFPDEIPIDVHGCEDLDLQNIILIENMSDRMNCEYLFNLLSIYGIVKKIGFLDAHRALIELRGSECAVSVCKSLEKKILFGKKIDVKNISTYSLLLNDGKFYEYKSFSNPKYIKSFDIDKVPEVCQDLAIKSFPPSFTFIDIQNLFIEAQMQPPITMPAISKSFSSETAFVCFQSEDSALQTVAILNNKKIKLKNETYSLKLNFQRNKRKKLQVPRAIADLPATISLNSSQKELYFQDLTFSLNSEEKIRRMITDIKAPQPDIIVLFSIRINFTYSGKLIFRTPDLAATAYNLMKVAFENKEENAVSFKFRPPSMTPYRSLCLWNVLLIDNLSDDISCDSLFNILCLYSKIKQIRFFEFNRALVEIKHSENNCIIPNLNGKSLFGRTLRIKALESWLPEYNKTVLSLKNDKPSWKWYLDRNVFHPGFNIAKASSLLYFRFPINNLKIDIATIMSQSKLPLPAILEVNNHRKNYTYGTIDMGSEESALETISELNNKVITEEDETIILRLNFKRQAE